jgi:hypothetical protein
MNAYDVLGRRVKPNDVDSIVLRQLQSGSVWSDRGDVDNVAGLLRAIRALVNSPLQNAFITAAVTRITDPDANVRVGALQVARSFGGKIGAGPLLLRAWQEHPEFYRGLTAPIPEGSLESLLVAAMAAAVRPGDADVVEMLRKLALDPQKRDLVIGGLARVDPNWMIKHVEDWLGDDGRRLAAILGNVPDELKVEQVVREISKSPPQVRAGASDVIRRFVPDRDRAAHLISLLG